MIIGILILFVFVLAFVMGLIAKSSNEEELKKSNLVETKEPIKPNNKEPVQVYSSPSIDDDELLNKLLDLHKKERSVAFFVNGGMYRSEAAQEEYCLLTKGLDVQLKTEPNNTYDRYAVKVMSSRKHIGYVAKEESRLVYQVVEQGCVSDCIVLDNHYANENDDADLMYVRLFITSDFVNRWRLHGYDDAEEK